MTITATEARDYIKASIAMDREETIDAIKRKFNCHESDVDDAWNVWIANPQSGHWLGDDMLVELVEWIEAQ